MGFDVFGPTKHCSASNIDDGATPSYDLLALPSQLEITCPQLDLLHQRFYASTVISYEGGAVEALRNDITTLRDAYSESVMPTLRSKCHARDRQAATWIIDRMLQADVVYQAIEAFLGVCEDAITEKSYFRCRGD